MIDCSLALRKLAEQRRNVEQKKEKRSIIDEHADFASKVRSASMLSSSLTLTRFIHLPLEKAQGG